jgi:hypothetical protein
MHGAARLKYLREIAHSDDKERDPQRGQGELKQIRASLRAAQIANRFKLVVKSRSSSGTIDHFRKR